MMHVHTMYMYLRDDRVGQEETNQSQTRLLKMFVGSLAVMDFDDLWLEICLCSLL